MKLKYFNINDTLDVLKINRRELAKRYFPDQFTDVDEKEKATAIMQEINSEYDFVINPENRLKYQKKEPVFNLKVKRAQSSQSLTVEEKQAQNIFHALTHSGNVDLKLLVKTFNSIKNLVKVLEIYQRKYSSDLLTDIEKYVKSKENRDLIIDNLKVRISSDAVNTFINFLSKYI